jgi:hypothetical protein
VHNVVGQRGVVDWQLALEEALEQTFTDLRGC